MKRIFLLISLFSVAYFGAMAQSYQSFGTNFKAEKPVIAPELLKKDISQTKEIQVEGEVESVCQAAGCWMKIKLADGKTMRVTFKDYGFFVPKDLAGTKVIFKGEPKVTTTPVSELKHYAADAGKSRKEIDAITEPLTELTFVADGVLVPEN